MPLEPTDVLGVTASESVRRERFEAAWEQGELFGILNVFADQGVNPASNDIVAEMIREKIRSAVKDPETAEALCPKDHYFGTKRPCLDTGYFETYNLPHVRLVDLRKQPIVSITEDGIETADESFGFDAIVYATGFDAMTGALVAADVAGRDGLSLKEKWAAGPSTYLGLMTAGFPNFFMLTGPGSPSVLSNMTVLIEQHVDWVARCLEDMREEGLETIEPTALAEAGWDQHVQDCGAITLYPTANSWYMGANVPGKPRVFLPYIGGVDAYRQACDEVASQDYLGFRMTGPGGARCRDGVVRSMQPDVAMVLEFVAALGLPPMETLFGRRRAGPDGGHRRRPPAGSRGGRGHRRSDPRPGRGPAVPAVPPGRAARGPAPAGGVLPRRRLGARQPGLGRPAMPGPVRALGRGGRVGELPPRPRGSLSRRRAGRLRGRAVGGRQRHRTGRLPRSARRRRWSAGANVAAVACQLARDAAGPRISGQLLICPVVDSDITRPSYEENGDGYILTTALMRWFWDHYADPADRGDPRAAPLRGDLEGCRPPGRGRGLRSAPRRGRRLRARLEAAGVPVRLARARGHTHTSVTMVDAVISGAPVRAGIGEALRDFFPSAEPQEQVS